VVTTGLAHQIRRLLCQADREQVPDRMLALLGSNAFPDGTEPARVLTQAAWEFLYFLLENAALDDGVVSPLGQVQAGTRDIRPDEPMPIAIASFRVAVPDPAFVERVKAAAEHGNELQEPPRCVSEVVDVRRVFAATALLHDQWGSDTPVYRGGPARFVIDPRFLLSRPGAPWPDRIEVDCGAGFAARQVGEPFTAGAGLGDDRVVKVRCWYGDEQLDAAFTFEAAERAVPEPDDTWLLQGLVTAGQAATGRAWVYRVPGAKDVVNPVILVEGVPGGQPADYLYELLDNKGLVGKLRAAGYDLVIVGLDNGLQPIQANVGVLIDCIRQARKRTPRPLVVGGLSMGGIISRLALAQLEKTGEAHATRAYLSIDAPHGGSYTSLGVQWFVHALLPYMRGLGGYAMLLDSPSNQQLMLEYLHGGGGGPSPLRAGLLQALADVGGYPRQPRKLAVSCGRRDGVGGAAAGVRTLSWSGNPFVAMTLRTLPGDAEHHVVAEGEWFLAEPQPLPTLARPGALPWETAPGSLNDYNDRAAKIAHGFGCGDVETDHPLTCGVPTVSALDLDQSAFGVVEDGTGPFDAHTCSATNVQHLELTEEVSDWIVDELGAPDDTDSDCDPPWNRYAFDPHDAAFLNNPYPTYERFREKAPAFYVTQYSSRWFFGHSDCRQILGGKETFVKARPGGAPPRPGPVGIMSVYPHGIFSSDPPRHTALRSQIEPPFTAALATARPMAEGYATAILSKLAPTGSMELVTDFAIPVPANVLFDLVGIPADELVRKGLLAWEIPIVLANDPTQTIRTQFEGATAVMALHHYMQGLLRKYRLGSGPGVLGALAQAIGPTLTEEDVYASCVDFVVAGYLSTTWLIASAIQALLAHPSQMQKLRARPAKIEDALTEALRLEPPFQLIDRYVAQETTLGGVDLKVGDKVTAVVGSANRDPAVFPVPDPDEFDMDRENTAQLSFGSGIHYCIGAPLARIVAPAMLSALLRLDDLEIAGYAQWGSDPFLRGMTNLPLRFKPELPTAVTP
jgi:cytochrome P450